MGQPRRSAIAAFGGGHGLHTSLTVLRRITDRLTAVVTAADDDGSLGRLRGEFGCLPLDDPCMVLAVLCGDDQVGRRWTKVLQSRPSGDRLLGGHAIGNLPIAGFWQWLNDPVVSLNMVGKLLRTRGRVLPTSSAPLQIEIDVLGLDPLTPDELCILTEQAIVAKTRATVQSIRLVLESPPAYPETVAVVRQAGVIVLGSGPWLISVIPHLLAPELHDAILSTPARRILVMNITAVNKTDGFTTSQHTGPLAEYAPTLRLDFALAGVGSVGSDRHLAQFAAFLGVELAAADIRCHDDSAHHDPKRLADVYQELLAS